VAGAVVEQDLARLAERRGGLFGVQSGVDVEIAVVVDVAEDPDLADDFWAAEVAA
jgi:hypothetical protein